MANLTSVVAAGAEFAGDVLASTLVAFGMGVAVWPPDSDHPYEHGKYETLAGFIVGIVLAAGGVGICWRSLQKVSEMHDSPGAYAALPLLAAILLRSIMATVKFRVGRRIRSTSLIADAWNDAVDILSASAAFVALGLTLLDPISCRGPLWRFCCGPRGRVYRPAYHARYVVRLDGRGGGRRILTADPR